MHQDRRVAGRGWLYWVGSFPSPCVSWELNWVFRLGGSHLYPWNHLTGPLLNIVLETIITALHLSLKLHWLVFFEYEKILTVPSCKNSALIHRALVSANFRPRVNMETRRGYDSRMAKPERHNWYLSRIKFFQVWSLLRKRRYPMCAYMSSA